MRRLPTVALALVLAAPVLAALPGPPAHAAGSTHSGVAPSVERLTLTLTTPAPAAAPSVPGSAGVRSSAPRTAHDFSLVGATWSASALPAGGVVQVRTRDAAGHWGDWTALGAEDAAPDPAGADAAAARRAGAGQVQSAPLWTGPATAVQVRAPLPSVTVDLVDPGPSPAMPAAPAAPAVYSRASWGADESLRARNPGCGTPSYAATVKVAFVHHTDGTNGYAAADVPSIIRGIYAYHVLSHGWCDIGYNFLVDSFGRVWEGRYGGIDKPVIGAHTGGFNTYSTGVAMIGDYTSATPSGALQAALAHLLAWKLSLTYASPVGAAVLTSAGGPDTNYPSGYQLHLNVISGHRDADPTSCPGNAGYATLPALRRTVLADTGEGLVNPSISVAGSSGGSLSGTFGAQLLSPSAWSFTVRSATGSVVRVVTGSGASIGGSWDGRSATGALLAAGSYTASLTAGTARPYTVPFRVAGGTADVAVLGPSSPGGPHQIEVLSAGDGYHSFLAQRITPLVVTTPADWTFLLAPYSGPGTEDLVAIHERNTPSGNVDVFVVSQASSYHSFVLQVVTPLALSDPTQWDLSMAALGGDGRADLFAVRRDGGSSGRVEIHVLSASSSFHTFSLHAATAMPAVAGTEWRMVCGDAAGLGDLTMVRVSGAGTGAVEVHRLSAASHWTATSLAVATPVAQITDPQQLAGLRIGLGDANADGVWDLVLTYLSAVSSGAVEVHALSGASDDTTWAALRVTPLATRDPAVWTAATAH